MKAGGGSTDASGGTCPMIFQSTLRSISVTAVGDLMELSTGSTIVYAERCDVLPIGKQSRASRWPAANLSRQPKKGICRFDAGKHMKVRKRHLVADTIGLVLSCYIRAASMHEQGEQCGLLLE
jgi:hypothetical protein